MWVVIKTSTTSVEEVFGVFDREADAKNFADARNLNDWYSYEAIPLSAIPQEGE